MNICGQGRYFAAINHLRDVFGCASVGFVQDTVRWGVRDGRNIDMSSTLLNSPAESTHKMDCLVSHLK
jgi:hypothetical protein